MELTKQRAKDVIADYEYNSNNLKHISGSAVEIKNIKIRKHEVCADVILCFENKKERYNDCNYPIKLFKEAKV